MRSNISFHSLQICFVRMMHTFMFPRTEKGQLAIFGGKVLQNSTMYTDTLHPSVSDRHGTEKLFPGFDENLNSL